MEEFSNGNATPDDAAGYLQALAEFGGTVPDADGIATFEFGAVTLHFAQAESRPGRVVVRAEIGSVGDLASPEDFLEDLLAGAFFGQGTQLATPSVDKDIAYLTYACRIGILSTPEALETFTQRFTVLVNRWRQRLARCAKKDSDQESDGLPPDADISAFERIMV